MWVTDKEDHPPSHHPQKMPMVAPSWGPSSLKRACLPGPSHCCSSDVLFSLWSDSWLCFTGEGKGAHWGLGEMGGDGSGKARWAASLFLVGL